MKQAGGSVGERLDRVEAVLREVREALRPSGIFYTNPELRHNRVETMLSGVREALERLDDA